MTMNECAGLLITQIWQVSLLAMVVAITTRLLARNRPHLAHALWVLVLLKCITPPIWSSPASAFSWIGGGSKTPTIEPAWAPAPGGRRSLPATWVVRTTDDRQLASRKSKTEQLPSQPEASASSMIQSPKVRLADWQTAVLLMWGLGSLVGAVIAAARFAIFTHLIRKYRTRHAREIDLSVMRLSKKLGLKRTVRVSVIDKPIGPAVIGLSRPTVLLPSVIVSTKSLAELEILIAHELVHVRRGDLWWAMLQSLATSLWWFHPLVWLAARMVTRESERSCDEETIASLGCKPAAYARGLLDVLERKHQLRVAPALPGVRPVGVTHSRLERIMSLRQGGYRRTPLWVWPLLLLSAACVLPGAAMVIAQDENAGLGQPKTATVYPAPPRPLATSRTGQCEPAPNPATEAGSGHEVNREWKLQTFQAGDILAKLRRMGLDREMAEERLLGLLPIRRPVDGKSSTPRGLEVQFTTSDGIHRLGNSEPTIELVGDVLYVFDNQQQRNLLGQMLELFRQYGFEQVTLDMRLLSIPKDQLAELDVAWSDAHNPLTAQAAQVRPSRVVEAAFSQPEPDHSAALSATQLVTKNFPAAYSVLDATATKEFLRTCQSHVRVNLLSAPKMTIFNGQPASLMLGTERPFVTGFRSKESDQTADRSFQPIVKTVEEGLRIDVRPVLQEENLFQLNLSLSLTEILSVETIRTPRSHGEDTAEVPQVATSAVQSALAVPVGNTLVIRGLRRPSDEDQVETLVLITCRQGNGGNTSEEIIPPDAPAKNASEFNNLPDTQSDADLQRDSAEPDLIIWAGDKPTSRKSAEHLPLIKALSGVGIDAVTSGDLQYHVDNQGLQVEGQQLGLASVNASFEIRGDSGKLEISHSGEVQCRFTGHVMMQAEGMIATADALRLHEGKFLLRGSVRLFDDKTLLEGEEIVFGFDGEVYTVDSAGVTRTSVVGKLAPMRADRNEWGTKAHKFRIRIK